MNKETHIFEQMFKLPANIDNSWTLFLDRDGVINEKLEADYVKRLDEFKFKKGSLEAISKFSQMFGRIIIVTNQQGIGKGLMTEQDLSIVHDYMKKKIVDTGGRIDSIQYCPHLASAQCNCRKPNTQMVLDAQNEFSEIDFSKSVLIGDSISDIEMGDAVGMHTIHIDSKDSLLNFFK